MSYIPDIIISKKDLEKNRKRIENNSYEDDFYYKEQNDLLLKVLEETPIVFKKIPLLIIPVDLSTPNKLLREYLEDMDIPFAVTN